jgi:hypothetical protein
MLRPGSYRAGLALAQEGAGEREDAARLWTEAKELYAPAKLEAGVVESERRLAIFER